MKRYTNRIFGKKIKIRYKKRSLSFGRWVNVIDDNYLKKSIATNHNCSPDEIKLYSSESVYKSEGKRETISLTGAMIGWYRYQNQFFVIKESSRTKKKNFGGIKDVENDQKNQFCFLSKVEYIDQISDPPKFWTESYSPLCVPHTSAADMILDFSKAFINSKLNYHLDIDYIPEKFELTNKPNFRFTAKQNALIYVDKDYRDGNAKYGNNHTIETLPLKFFDSYKHYSDSNRPFLNINRSNILEIYSEDFLEYVNELRRIALSKTFIWKPEHKVYQLRDGISFDETGYSITPGSMLDSKINFFRKCVEACSPKSHLDIGCNLGAINYIADLMGAKSLGIESYWSDGGALEWGAKLKTIQKKKYTLAYWDNSLFHIHSLGSYDLISMFSIAHHGPFKTISCSQLLKYMAPMAKYFCFEFMQHLNGREQEKEGETIEEFKSRINEIADVILYEQPEWKYAINAANPPSKRHYFLLNIKPEFLNLNKERTL